MPCWLFNLAYMASITILTAFSLLKLLGLLHRAQANTAAVHLARLNIEHEQSSSGDSRRGLMSVEHCFVLGDVCRTYGLLLSIIFGRHDARVETLSANEVQERYEESLRLAKEANTVRALVIALSMFCFPGLVIYLVILGVTPTWQSCVACDITFETIIMLMLMYIFVFFARHMLAERIAEQPDPDDVVADMKKSSLFFLGIALIMLVLLGADPGRLDFSYLVSWEWLMQLAGVQTCYVHAIKPLMRLARERREVANSGKGPVEFQLPPVEASLENTVIMKRFEAYAEQQYCTELVRFIDDVSVFEALFYQRAPKWRQAQAVKICERYISAHAMLPVNLSYDMRVKVEAKAHSNNVAHDVFVPARREVYKLIRENRQLWKDFVLQGGCKDAEAGVGLATTWTPQAPGRKAVQLQSPSSQLAVGVSAAV